MNISRRNFLAVTAGVSATALAPFTFGGTATAAADLKTDWMSYIDSTTPIHRLTIPGTHDTGALYGGGLTQCQTLSLTQQLNSGIRFFDIRCRAFEGNFFIHHGSVYQNLTFDDVLRVCRAFMLAHPSETILMRVQQEYSNVSPQEFMVIFNHYMDNRGWRYLFFMQNRLPQLGEVRGKVALLGNGSGLPGISWNGPLMDMQDDYQVPTLFHREQKYQKVANTINRALATPNGSKLFVNFASGSSIGCWPSQVASYVNPRLERYINELRGKYTIRPALGAIPMDFPEYTPKLTEALIRWNNGF